MRAHLVVLVLCVTLAGCSDRPAPDPAEPLPMVRDVEARPGVGAVSGVLVDETIRPVADATVSLRPSGASTRTDEGGRFVFESLEPGMHVLEAQAPGHGTVQAVVDVEAGAVATLRMMMPLDKSAQPYHLTHHHHGFAEAYVGLVSFTLENSLPDSPGCDCAMVVVPEPDAATFVFEAFGEAWTDAPSSMGSVYYEVFNNDGRGDALSDGFVIHSAYADFPIHDAVPRDTWPAEATEWTVRLTGGSWVHPHLEYDMFLTVFHRAPAPDGWSVVA